MVFPYFSWNEFSCEILVLNTGFVFLSFLLFLSFFLLQTQPPCSSTHKYIPKNRNPLLIFMILVFDLRIPGFGFGFSGVCGFELAILDHRSEDFCVGVFGFSVFVVVV